MIDRRLAFLLLAAIGLAGYSLWSGDGALMGIVKAPDAPVGAATSPRQEAAGAPAPIAVAELNPLNGLKPEQFDEILKRPLFNPSRAPAPPPPEPQPEPQPVATEEPPPQEPPPNPEDFTLLGIAAKDGIWTAVMRWNPTNEVFRLKTGGEMQGWTVAAIAPQGVTVTKAEQSLDIKMFLQKGGPPPAVDQGGGEDGMMDGESQPPQSNGQQQYNPQAQINPQAQPDAAMLARQADERRRALQEQEQSTEAQ